VGQELTQNLLSAKQWTCPSDRSTFHFWRLFDGLAMIDGMGSVADFQGDAFENPIRP
jgi:hypothetical protein